MASKDSWSRDTFTVYQWLCGMANSSLAI